MKASVPYIKERFDLYNRLIFEGKLPVIPIKMSNAKTFLGQCAFRKRILPNGRVEYYDFCLKISTCVDLPKDTIDDIVVHEMIHYYIAYNCLEDSSVHGMVFRKLMHEINTKYGRNVQISHRLSSAQKEEMYGAKKSWHVVAVVRFVNGRVGIKVLPRVAPRILHYYNNVSKSSQVKRIDLYMSNDVFFNRFPNSSALNVVYVDGSELENHLHDAVPMECDGVRIVRK